ncbi:MAG: ACP S-malonyltransferase [Dehalococcoidia bacterium]|nr:ACP S-malonyltransferase [Dehalococcoidia bacterium]
MTPGKVAFVFPGQGSQSVGMGMDIYGNYASARQAFEEADSVLGFELSRLCFNGPEEELVKTVNVQPAVLTVSIAYLRAAQEAHGDSFPTPGYVAGHSLGQYSALVACGALSFADALRLVRERGRLMYEAGQSIPGGMSAVIGADEAVVREICNLTGTEISNVNCPGQVVVSGAALKLGEFFKLALERGIRRVMTLKVSGAFHSRLMQPAAAGLQKAIAECSFKEPACPVVSNVTAEMLGDGASIRKELSDQLVSCVQWQRSVENMIKNGVTAFYEIGHGQVLGGLIRRIDPEARVYYISELLKTMN